MTIGFVKNVNPISRQVQNIRYLIWKEKTPVEVKTAYGDKVMNRKSVFKSYHKFKNSRMSVHDDQRSRRPSIVTDEIMEKIENALRHDRRLTVNELSALFPQISRSLLHKTITKTLRYRKLYEVCPKTADRPIQVESSGGRARVFEMLQLYLYLF